MSRASTCLLTCAVFAIVGARAIHPATLSAQLGGEFAQAADSGPSGALR